MNTDQLETALASWLTGSQKIINDYYASQYPTMPVPLLTVMKGKRYWRIARSQGSNRSVHAFIDSTNGDVLKADGWKAPAKGARGNLFDAENGLARMGVYGTEYNR